METVGLLVAGEAALVQARQACDAAYALCSSSSWLVRYARVLRSRKVRCIRGGADLAEDGADAIRARLRRLVDAGTLPRAEPRPAWSCTSPGAGSCAACERALTKGELECELTTATAAVILRFHPRCLRLYAGVVAERGNGDRITSLS
jgi:hypothetical protein